MSDLYNILCIITPGDTAREGNQLVTALKELVTSLKKQGEMAPVKVMLPDIPVLSITPRDAFYADTEVIPIDDSVGRTIAEFIMVYPPGIPIFIPGEIITQENIII